MGSLGAKLKGKLMALVTFLFFYYYDYQDFPENREMMQGALMFSSGISIKWRVVECEKADSTGIVLCIWFCVQCARARVCVRVCVCV